MLLDISAAAEVNRLIHESLMEHRMFLVSEGAYHVENAFFQDAQCPRGDLPAKEKEISWQHHEICEGGGVSFSL